MFICLNHICLCVLIWLTSMSHVTDTNELQHTCLFRTMYVYMFKSYMSVCFDLAHNNESRHTYPRVTTHISTRHVANTHEACHTYACAVLQCIAVYCSVSQCIAVYYSVLQCITVYYSVFKPAVLCVAACCSVL